MSPNQAVLFLHFQKYQMRRCSGVAVTKIEKYPQLFGLLKNNAYICTHKSKLTIS